MMVKHQFCILQIVITGIYDTYISMLEVIATPLNLTNQVKFGHGLDQSRSVQFSRENPAYWDMMAMV